jgi:GNAT superfamily N-acetyltransferase
MSSRLVIARVGPGDVDTLLALVRELAEFERLSREVVATPAQLDAALFGPQANVEAVLARLDDEVVGFALWFHNFSTFVGRRGLYLEDLYVRPAHRGRGYGQALLRHLAAIAVERGCGRMEWAVLDWNRRAIDFYQGLGAEPQEAWRIFRLCGVALGRMAKPD